MKFSLLAVLGLMSVSAFAQNLKCVNDDLVLVLQKTTKRSVPYIARFSYKNGGGYYNADCEVLENSALSKKMECAIEFEWTFFETVAIVDLAKDKKSATLTPTSPDRRFSTGYKLGKKENLKCSPTLEDAQ